MIAAAGIEDLLFQIANALRVPVFVAALGALIFVLFDLGTFSVELSRRRRRANARGLERASNVARAALLLDDVPAAARALRAVASSGPMADAFAQLVGYWGQPGASDRMAKSLADFDLGSLRRLERSRMLVRFGPALGLMGTLIPLSPALAGLAKGNVKELSDNLRVAFSVTVLGLLIGAVAFSISLVRDRLYAQDLSDLEFVATELVQEEET
ncbi:MAG: MotA/TolQ/ExbB proton channel family protein [Solirubrobacteraceae bacterium]